MNHFIMGMFAINKVGVNITHLYLNMCFYLMKTIENVKQMAFY